jgi:nucleotide-binding universal stress UspA family protein
MAFTIVVGYDGSDGAKAALDEAVDLARRLSGELLITYAFGGRKQYAGAPLTPRQALRDLGQRLLDEAMERVAGSGVDARPVLVDDNSYRGLISVAEQHDAGMIVVGTYGEFLFSGVLLGSTPYRLVHSATRPVLVVPVRAQQGDSAAKEG